MPDYVIAGDPIPPEYTTAAGINRNTRTLAELRAILAPLLDNPFVETSSEEKVVGICVFCGQEDEGGHADACPVLCKDKLLGRC